MRRPATLAILLGLMLAFGACNKGPGGGGTSASGDMSLGPANAKVTVNEFASLGCPICAKWNNEVFPAFKAKYIDTGKVHYVFHEFLTGDLPVAGAGFLLAHCAGKDKYFQVLDAVFHQEADLLESDQGAAKRARLVNIAGSVGMTEPQFETCVSDDAALKALNDRSDAAHTKYNIESTPTFIINGKSYVGFQDLAMMDKAIADAEAGAK